MDPQYPCQTTWHVLHSRFWQSVLGISSCPLRIDSGKFSRRSAFLYLCLPTSTNYPKHLVTDWFLTLTFDLPTSPQNNDPFSSTLYKLKSSLLRGDTVEPSGTTTFLKTQPAKHVDVTFFYFSFDWFVICLSVFNRVGYRHTDTGTGARLAQTG